MLRFRLIRVAALAIPLLVPSATALACPTSGGRDAAFEPDDSQADTLIEAARHADRSAAREDSRARSARLDAKRHREIAADLRENARTFPDTDFAVLLAKAVVEEKQALVDDARAASSAKRAKTFRQKANELRVAARKLLAGQDVREI